MALLLTFCLPPLAGEGLDYLAAIGESVGCNAERSRGGRRLGAIKGTHYAPLLGIAVLSRGVDWKHLLKTLATLAIEILIG